LKRSISLTTVAVIAATAAAVMFGG